MKHIKNFRLFESIENVDISHNSGMPVRNAIKNHDFKTFKELIENSNISDVDNKSKNDMFGPVKSPNKIKNIISKYIKEYNCNNFIDIGSGMGDIVRYVDSLGLNSEGIEIDNTLKEYNIGLNIHFKSAFNHDYSGYDIIYLYRPMESKGKMDKLFEKISSDIKKNTIIIYLFPHFFEEIFPSYFYALNSFKKETDLELRQIVSRFNLNVIKTGQFNTGDLIDEYIILKNNWI